MATTEPGDLIYGRFDFDHSDTAVTVMSRPDAPGLRLIATSEALACAVYLSPEEGSRLAGVLAEAAAASHDDLAAAG
jgi:hypothetical protein